MHSRLNLLLSVTIVIVSTFFYYKKGDISSSIEIQQSSPQIVRISATPKGAGMPHIYFRNQNEGWVWYNNTVWQTLDGGANWSESQLESLKGDINSLEILATGKLWILAGDSLGISNDGGKTWNNNGKLPFGYPQGILLKIIFMPTTRTGWLIGSKYLPISKEEALESAHLYVSKELDSIEHGAIYKTVDGGNTWKEQLISSSVGRFENTYFLTQTHGVVVGTSGIYFTIDGGTKWLEAIVRKECLKPELEKAIINHQYEWYPIDISLYSNNEGWLTYNDGRLLKTKDGGKSWCDQQYKMPQYKIPPLGQNILPVFLRKVRFVDERNGYALRSDGIFLKSEDSGITWLSNNLLPRFEDIHILGRKFVFAVSSQGIYKITY